MRFAYGVQTWKGQMVIRRGPSQVIYHLFFDKKVPGGLMHFALDHDIIRVKQTTAYEHPCPDKDALKRGKPGEDKSYLAPGDETAFWNPTKDTPSYYRLLDSGDATVYVDQADFKKFLLKGKTLKGLYTLTREEKDSPLFILKRSAGPGGKL